MRRAVITARSSAGPLVRAAVYQQQPRRTFATGGTPPSSKSEAPTTPVDRSKDQAHAIGAYYEGVLNGSKNYPDTKPELPPVTSQKYPTKLAPAEPEAKPEPEKEKKQQAEPEPSKPKQGDNVSSTPAPTPSQPTPKKEGEQQQPPVKQEKQQEEKKKPASATTATSATPTNGTKLEPAKKTDEKGDDEAIIAKAVTPEPIPAKRAAAVVRKPRELKKIKDPQEAKEPKVVKSAQATSSQSQADPTPSSNPSGNLSSSDGSGTAPTPQGSSENEGEAGNTRIIFSASLASAAQRAERLASIRAQSKLVAGVLVPPRPEEPDNCCMSGCVNCVWDLYRDEMEAWATTTAEAEQRLAAQEAGLGEEGAVAATGAVEAAGGSQQTSSVSGSTSTSRAAEGVKGTELGGTAHSVVDQRGAVSMDDDGGGSSSNWDFGTAQSPATGAAGASGTKTSTSTVTDTTWNDDLYKNVPVGIREFMKQEKRLKEKHAREGTVG